MKYKERRLKLEEERNIKKEMKLEELRELQREINYSKSIDDEFKRTQMIMKSKEREIARPIQSRARNFSCAKSKKVRYSALFPTDSIIKLYWLSYNIYTCQFCMYIDN